ncbi:MAG: PD40 domain-containing protein [Chloroflexi bacterium]|nr:PD40 domain-containing protein [Chloroflexota bacterium]
MFKQSSRTTLILFLLAVMVLAACAPRQSATPAPAPPLEPSATEEIPHTQTTPAEEIVLVSIEEDGHSHLFAYIPGVMSLTRLTNGDWDDITPSVHPGGQGIAFASNRFGQWDLYRMDFATGDLTRLTNTPEYEAAPSWSPDGSFIAYETYLDDNLEIVVGPAEAPAENAIRLTASPGADHSPAWSPGGRQIVFVSDGEIILADLDRTGEARFKNLSNTPLAYEAHPVWSPDGSKLAWAAQSQNIGRSGIYLWNAVTQLPAEWFGDGNLPAWGALSDQITSTVAAPNTGFIITYALDGTILQPLTPFPYQVNGMVRANLSLPNPMPKTFNDAAYHTPAPLWAANGAPIQEGASGRWSLKDLPDVQAPYPQLHDLADEAFNALRMRVIEEAGWDALASLENAFVPLTSDLDPGFATDWLYTGRAFAINSLMTNAGWMVAVREDFGAQTYWRLYLRAQLQDGSQGMPLHNPPWDLRARYNLDPQTYEQGGTYSDVPPGYWVDMTALALQYGWERVPALPNWRTFFAGARFTEFTLTDGLDWYSAMLQLYPPDVLVTPTRLLPPTLTPTRTPTNTPTPTNTRTPRPTRTPTATRTPSITPTPPNTLTPSPTPPTVVP